MPETDMDAIAEAEAVDAEVTSLRQQELAGAIPMADEPLDPGRLNAIADLLSRAIPALSGGQVPAPPFGEIPPGTRGVDQVPPDIGAAILALGQFVQDQGIEAYAFDPLEAMTSNAGLDEVSAILDGMASDKALVASMAQGGPAGATVEREVS